MTVAPEPSRGRTSGRSPSPASPSTSTASARAGKAETVPGYRRAEDPEPPAAPERPRVSGIKHAQATPPETAKSATTKTGKPDAAEAPEDEAPKKKSKKKLLAVVLIVVVLAGGGMFYKKLHKVVYKPGQPVPPGQVLALGKLTVNTSDGHYVQVGIDLQLTKPASLKTVQPKQPQLLNAAIADLGQQTYTGLLAPTGRSALLHELLVSFQQVLGTVDGAAQQVSAVYFTSFVLQ